MATLVSCNQVKKPTPKNEEVETANSLRNYSYADSAGKLMTIYNGLPKGNLYIDPKGQEYFKAVFWSRMVNESDHDLTIEIKLDSISYEVPELPNVRYKILIPSDTMTMDKQPLYDYGLKSLKSFLDHNIDQPSIIKRTIAAKDSTGFYVIILSKKNEEIQNGTLRTGFVLKGRNLFYRISRYASKPGLPLISEEEILCGNIK